MRGQHYENDEAVQQTVRTWLQNAETDFYHSGIFRLVQHCQKWPDSSGDFGEQWRHIQAVSGFVHEPLL
jgi:hypothetical protein